MCAVVVGKADFRAVIDEIAREADRLITVLQQHHGGTVAFAERLAKDRKATLPSGYAKDFDICRRFLDQHAGR